MHLRRPSPGLVIAVVALFIALGGTAFAAKHYLITSTGQIKPSVLKKLRGNRGPAGAKGATGATGATGAAGPAGAPGALGKEGPAGKEGKEGPPGPVELAPLTEFRGEEEEVEEEEFNVSVAECPSGSRAVSGGFFTLGPPPNEQFSEAFEIEFEEGEVFRGWVYGSNNPSSTEAQFIEAIAYCAAEGKAITTAAVHSGKTRSAVKAAVLAKLKARRAHRAH